MTPDGNAFFRASNALPATMHMTITNKITELLPIGLFRADLTGRVSYANQRWCDIANINLNGSPSYWSHTIHPDDRARIEQEWRKCIEHKQPFAAEFRYLHTNQREVWVSCQIVLEFSEEEKLTGLIGTIADITDRVQKSTIMLEMNSDLEQRVEERTADLRAKNRWLQQVVTEREQAEKALREERNYISAILDTAGALVIVCDPTGRILSFNHSCQTRSCFSAEEVKGKHLWEVCIPEEDREAIKDVVQRLTLRNEPVKLNSKWVNALGQHSTISWTNTALRNENNTPTHIIFTGIDITDQLIAQQAAQQRQAELVHVSRLSTMGEMAAGLAHELNQPLTAIVSYAQGSIRRLSSETDNSEDIIPALHQVTAQAQRAGDIIRRLRKFVSKGELQRSPVTLTHLIDDAVRMASIEIENNSIQVEYQHESTELSVNADFIQIEQVILNLIINGIEAMSTCVEHCRELCIRSFVTSDRYAEICVSDNGEGIPRMYDANKLFETFFTTKKDGMGMGLSICRSIVEAHGGRIWASKNLHRGTTFHFTLPLV